MKRLIYSYLITNNGAGNYVSGSGEIMLDLWVRSLREAGNYKGDILLFTDRLDLKLPQVITCPLVLPQIELKQLYVARILNYKNLPYRDYDTLMHLDLDAICVNDINGLFATHADLRAAPSNLLLFEPKHIGLFLNRLHRIWYRYLSPRRHRKGVSACVYSCASWAWEKNMGAWAGVIEQYKDSPIPELSDQSYLNLIYFRKTIPIKPYARDEIQHRDWFFSPQARILHFPGLADRAAMMNRYYSLYGNTGNMPD